MPPAEPIRSRSHPLVRRLRALKQKSDRELCLLEGPKLLAEAVNAGVVFVEVAASARAVRAPGTAELVARLAADGVPVRTLAEDVLESLSETETSQGVVALARRPVFAESDLQRGAPLLLVAVAVQDPGNLGGLLRTAEAAGATGAYLTEGCADPLSWKALRGSMGSAFRLPHRKEKDPLALLGRLRGRGVRTVAAVADGGTAYDRADLSGTLAIVMGTEGRGLAEPVIAATDLRVTIPLAPPVESLNVGVAGALLLFEAARQRRVR
jgi:TrmH family RNA methyltransferase